MRGNTVTIEVSMKRGKMAKSVALYQYDYGQKLKLTNVELPNTYEVHFSNELHGDALSMIGDTTGVLIPDELLTTGLPVYFWVFLHEGIDDGETEYIGTVPVIQRAKPSEIAPTPEEQSVIAQAIAAINAGVDSVEQAARDVESTIQSALQEAKDSGEFDGADGANGQDGQDGISPTIGVTAIEGGYRLTITDASGTNGIDVLNGVDGATGPAGADGSDGADGTNGQDGEDGYSPTATVTKDGSVTTISITDKSGTTTATVSDGEDGSDGQNGVDGADGESAYVHIKYASEEPTQDSDMKTTPDAWIGIYSGESETAPTTYTSYTWYEFKGADGTDGQNGQDGQDGQDGVSAYVHIRYAAAQPTSDSDMKTTPDAWIGIYSGTSSTAPTTYTSYTWYQFKGDQGQSGLPSVTSSDNGKIMRVVNGVWGASTLNPANGVSF